MLLLYMKKILKTLKNLIICGSFFHKSGTDKIKTFWFADKQWSVKLKQRNACTLVLLHMDITGMKSKAL